MSIRSDDIAPSAQIEIGGEVYPVVTLEDLQQALLRAAVVLDLCGGCFGVVLQRIDTGVPNEKLTTRAIMTWQDRTNARAQPETTAQLAEPEPPVSPEPAAEEPVALDNDEVTGSRPDIFAAEPALQA